MKLTKNLQNSYNNHIEEEPFLHSNPDEIGR